MKRNHQNAIREIRGRGRRIHSLLAVGLAAAMLVSCAKQDGRLLQSKATPYQPSSSALPAENVELSVWMRNNSQGYAKSYNDMLVFDRLREITGVRLSFQHPTGSAKEQLNIILASKNLPDVIISEWNASGLEQLNNGVAVRLNEYIDALAPNAQRVFSSRSEYLPQMTLADGSIVSFPWLADDEQFLCYDGFFLRQDWLDKTGKQVPETLEQWHDVLLAFRDSDPNGDGEADEVPFATLNWMFEGTFLPSFGIGGFGYYRDPETEEVTHTALSPNFRSYLYEMNRWYREGLLDKNYLNANENELESLMGTNRLGAVFLDNNNSIPKYMQQNPSLVLTAAPFPRAADGARYTDRNVHQLVTNTSALITTACGHIEEAVRFFDYLYTDEGQTLMNWGIEGQSYTIGPDGTKQFTDEILRNPDGKSPREAICKYITNTGFVGVSQYGAARGLEESLPEPIRRARSTSINYLLEADQSLILPAPKLTLAESGAVSARDAEIDAKLREMARKLILGVEPLDRYDAYIAEIKELGLEENLAVYRQAYHRQ